MTDEPHDDDFSKPKRAPRKKTSKAPSRYANSPHTVGKGKPPVQHQFKPGGRPGPGRPKGSRNKSDYDAIFDEKLPVGEDRLGRPIRKSARQVKFLQLRKKVMEGDFQAMKHADFIELRLAAIKARYGENPSSAADALRKAREDEQKRIISEKLTQNIAKHLNQMAQLKKLGLIGDPDAGPDGWSNKALNLFRMIDEGRAPGADTQ